MSRLLLLFKIEILSCRATNFADIDGLKLSSSTKLAICQGFVFGQLCLRGGWGGGLGDGGIK